MVHAFAADGKFSIQRRRSFYDLGITSGSPFDVQFKAAYVDVYGPAFGNNLPPFLSTLGNHE